QQGRSLLAGVSLRFATRMTRESRENPGLAAGVFHGLRPRGFAFQNELPTYRGIPPADFKRHDPPAWSTWPTRNLPRRRAAARMWRSAVEVKRQDGEPGPPDHDGEPDSKRSHREEKAAKEPEQYGKAGKDREARHPLSFPVGHRPRCEEAAYTKRHESKCSRN